MFTQNRDDRWISMEWFPLNRWIFCLCLYRTWLCASRYLSSNLHLQWDCEHVSQFTFSITLANACTTMDRKEEYQKMQILFWCYLLRLDNNLVRSLTNDCKLNVSGFLVSRCATMCRGYRLQKRKTINEQKNMSALANANVLCQLSLRS